MYVYFLLSILDYPCVMYKKNILCFMFYVFVFGIFVILVCMFKNTRLVDYRVIAGKEKDGAVELGSYESIRIGFKGKEAGLVAVILVRITICVCALLIGLVFYLFAPLFGAVLETSIGDINGHSNSNIGDFVQVPVGAILTAFIGIFGGLFGYADASMNDTKFNNGYLANDMEASQNNGLDTGLIAPHSGAGLTNFIGCNNGRGGETITTIIIRFLYCFNEYCNGFVNDRGVILTAIETTTMTICIKFKGVLTAPITITEGIDNIFAGASTTALENIIKGDSKVQPYHEKPKYSNYNAIVFFILTFTGSGGPCQESRALWSFGLIHGGSRDKTTIEVRNYLLKQSKNASTEVLQYGTCLALGFAQQSLSEEPLIQSDNTRTDTGTISGEIRNILFQG